MKLTLQIQLLPNAAQSIFLRETLARFNETANWLSVKAFDLRSANKVKLQQLFYKDVRAKFGLSAQMTVRCIAQVCEAYKRDRKKLPKFRKYASMPFDQRMMSFKGVDRVSLLTLQGRVIVPFVMGAYQRERFTNAKGQCDLVLRKDGKWFLLVTVDLPDKTLTPVTDFIGVDLGVIRLATTSDGAHFSGDAVESVRERYHERRQTLQHAASRRKAKGKRPKAIRRALRRTKSRESNFRKHENHVISKQLVELATGTKRGIALEDLTHIRQRTRFRKKQRAKMSGWSFSQLRTFIAYKLQLAGVNLVLVDPRNTSRTCAECGHCDKANRKSQSEFVCRSCGHADNADENAARNIRLRAIGFVSNQMFSEKLHSIAA